MPTDRALSAELWSGIEDIYAEILVHPFVAGLTDGTLDHAAFRFYVIQDAHYLRDYARALSVCSAKAPAEPEIAMFAQHAEGAIAVERELHESFFADLDVSEAELAATPQAPTCRAYTSYLLAATHGGSFAEGLAAVLPCYWIYREVGRVLLAKGSADPLFQRWIDTYGGAEFDAVVEQVITLCDRIGPSLGGADRALMAERFRTTSRYEWMFWDMGLHREEWPAPWGRLAQAPTMPGPVMPKVSS